MLQKYKEEVKYMNELTTKFIERINSMNDYLCIAEKTLDKSTEINKNNVKLILNNLSTKIQQYNQDDTNDMTKSVMYSK